MGKHELIYLFDHLEVLLEDLPLIHQALRYLPWQVLLLLDQVPNLHLYIVDISLLLLQQRRQRVCLPHMRFYLFNILLLLVSIVMVGGDEGSGSVVMERLVMV